MFEVAGGTDKPRDNELGIAVYGNPSPGIADVINVPDDVGDIAGLGVAKGPLLIALDKANSEVADSLVVMGLTSSTSFYQELVDGVGRYIQNAGDRAHGCSLAEHFEDTNSEVCGQAVHIL